MISAEQEERNRRAFEAWLMRKQDERKVTIAYLARCEV